MEKFKKVVNSNNPDKVAKAIELIDGQWTSLAQIERASSVLDASVRASVLPTGLQDANTFNGDTLQEIYSLKLPSYMSWDYWVAINQWVTYWVNRNTINCENAKDKEAFKLALSTARKYGTIGVTKEKDTYVVGVLTEQVYENGELKSAKLIPSFYANRYGYAESVSNTKQINWSKDTKAIDVKANDILMFTPREIGIGDFVMCMKDILIDIYLKTMIQSNASNLQDKMFVEVNNPDTLPLELAIAKNPFRTWALKIVDTQSGNGTNEFKFSESKGGEHSYINTLIETLKHHQEYYYAKFGRPISSNKAQALSSDSSLSISSAEAIANDWDDRVMEFADLWNEKFNTKIEIEKPELNVAPQNQNADKQGLGQALTDGDLMEKASKGEQ